MKHNLVVIRYLIEKHCVTLKEINEGVENAKVMLGAHDYVAAEVRALSTMRYEILITFVPQEQENA